jgi:hypothetical protein
VEDAALGTILRECAAIGIVANGINIINVPKTAGTVMILPLNAFGITQILMNVYPYATPQHLQASISTPTPFCLPGRREQTEFPSGFISAKPKAMSIIIAEPEPTAP